MSREHQSYTQLPAGAVIAACDATIKGIEETRSARLQAEIDEQLARKPSLFSRPPKTPEEAKKCISSFRLTGISLSYGAQETTAVRLKALARAAQKIGAPVMVTAADFAAIQFHYQFETKQPHPAGPLWRRDPADRPEVT